MRYFALTLRCGAVVVGAAVLPRAVIAQTVPPIHSGAAVKWAPAPDFLPRGARWMVLQGDPGKAGMHTIRLWFPDHYTIRPHWHPTDENVTVLSGAFLVGMGDSVDLRQTQRLTAGGFIAAPPNAHHYAVTRGVTIIQLSGEGPFAITYVKSTDDPRNPK